MSQSTYDSIKGRKLGIDALTGALWMKAKSGLTALAGGGQTGATDIPAALTRFTTVATAADSALLPPAKAGKIHAICNAAAANSMTVYPASGEAINALSADAGFAVAANKTALFICFVDGKWNTILTA